MDIASFSIGFAGFIGGSLLFASVLRWLATVGSIATDRTDAGGRGKLQRILLASLLGSGFWMLLVAAWIGYFVRAETWVMPLCVGVILALLFQIAVAVRVVVHMKRQADKKNAA